MPTRHRSFAGWGSVARAATRLAGAAVSVAAIAIASAAASPPVAAPPVPPPAALPGAEAEAPAATPQHPLVAFAGVRWTVRGAELAGAGRLDADVVFTPLFGGAAVHERTTVRVAEGGARVGTVYETLYAAPGDDGVFQFVTVGSDGSVMEGAGTVEDGVFSGATERRTDGARPGLRVLTPAANGGVRWRIERGGEGERSVHLDALMRREAAGALAIPAAEPDGPAARLRPMVGTWRTEAEWAGGRAFVGRNEIRLGRGAGYAVVDTHARDAGGPERHRSVAIYVEDAALGWVACTLEMTGALAAVPLALRDTPDGPAIDATTRVVLDGEPAEVAQTTAMAGPDTMRWTVRARPVGGGADEDWTELVDARWTRDGTGAAAPASTEGRTEPAPAAESVAEPAAGPAAGAAASPAAGAAAIDPARFDVRGEPGGMFTVERTVAATPAECFRLWSTEAGVRAFLGIDSRIELAVGGRYEWVLAPEAPAGSRGSEGCQVLGWVPDSMLSFTWAAPPTLGDVRERRSWVVVRFEPLEPAADGTPRTRVRLDHCGLGEGEGWERTEAYFRRAWPSVLEAMRGHLEAAADQAPADGAADAAADAAD